ncbi:RNA polymerase sigma-70 factor (ECF subfamily) [Neorhizobium huautlense]|uniref:RNA polymerase sigma-70 factor (ECF subfamily) n=1 Tax=Neorhizobium huautlense TaxID=67774 RepID=A0ABT9PUJ4_9HYPH|nr:sigma-70 family RNA polymerase sigma factor [Neorhizobium huautlense]MDP9837384.1 RNA polymerase sigma-70 factor (ECF subfamily) [Neorhizobium huautlense]
MSNKRQPFDVLAQLSSLRRYARSLVRHPDDAEDLVHDALVRAFERKATFRTGGNLRNWLLSIVHNTHIDRLRRAKSLDRRHDDAAYLIDTVEQADPNHSIRLKQLRDAFHGLPDEQRDALHLVAIEGLSYQEAANALSIPVGTLMSRISRAREKLRDFEEGRRSANPTHLKIIGGGRDETR